MCTCMVVLPWFVEVLGLGGSSGPFTRVTSSTRGFSVGIEQ